jgi:hypothetical protein
MQDQTVINDTNVIEILSNYSWPEVTDADMAFPTFSVPSEILDLYGKIKPRKGINKFSELFYKGGKIKPQKGIKGTWKEKALLFALALKGSWEPKHEHKEFACGLIFEHTLIL